MSWWDRVNGPELAQGDVILAVHVPALSVGVLAENVRQDDVVEAELNLVDVIVLSQSCDLRKTSNKFVTVCHIRTVAAFREEGLIPELATDRPLSAWDKVRKGEYFALHLLETSAEGLPKDQRLVVDFRVVLSVPSEYLKLKADGQANRLRLKSPFLEHFSQAFARFFMRVGLPSDMPPFDTR